METPPSNLRRRVYNFSEEAKNMAELVQGFNFSYYPKEAEVEEARNSLRPIGILSKVLSKKSAIFYRQLELFSKMNEWTKYHLSELMAVIITL